MNSQTIVIANIGLSLIMLGRVHPSLTFNPPKEVVIIMMAPSLSNQILNQINAMNTTRQQKRFDFFIQNLFHSISSKKWKCLIFC